METYYLVKGDTGSQLKVTLVEESTGVPISCADETVRLHFRKKGTSAKLFSLISIVTDPQLLSGGVAVFEFENNLANIASGYYVGEVELSNNTTGAIRTIYETLPFRVRDEIG